MIKRKTSKHSKRSFKKHSSTKKRGNTKKVKRSVSYKRRHTRRQTRKSGGGPLTPEQQMKKNEILGQLKKMLNPPSYSEKMLNKGLKEKENELMKMVNNNSKEKPLNPYAEEYVPMHK
jgi:hypothetical protein